MRVQGDAENSRPRQTAGLFQSSRVIPTGETQPRPRLRWRAIIHAGQKLDPARGQTPVAWHLADCDDPARSDAHCDLGRHLLASDGNPDGHCRVAGACLRCAEGTRPSDRT
jgi:hypothetical protein